MSDDTRQTEDEQNRATLHDLVRDQRIAMVATLDEDGAIVARPLTARDVEDVADLWFITTRDSSQVAHVSRDPRVNVTFSSDSAWISIAGTASVVDDDAQLAELWNQFADAWIPEGPTSDRAVLLRVAADSAEFWHSPEGRLRTVVKLARAKVTGDRPDVGESATVEL